MSDPLRSLKDEILALSLVMIADVDPSNPEADQEHTDYTRRNGQVYVAVGYAIQAGLEAGIGIDPAEPDRMVAYISLPTGQVSWHLPRYPDPYDGHSTPEKYDRVRRFALRSAEAMGDAS